MTQFNIKKRIRTAIFGIRIMTVALNAQNMKPVQLETCAKLHRFHILHISRDLTPVNDICSRNQKPKFKEKIIKTIFVMSSAKRDSVLLNKMVPCNAFNHWFSSAFTYVCHIAIFRTCQKKKQCINTGKQPNQMCSKA